MPLPESVRIVEVGPRDGLQNEKQTLPTSVKLTFIDMLAATGLRTIEVASFVRPDLLPQMGDATAILKGLTYKPEITYPVLVPNLKGLENGLAAGAKAIQVIASASESFSRKNSNCSIKQGLDRCRDIIARAHDQNIKVRGYISCCLGCPHEGRIDFSTVSYVAQELINAGCFEIALSDTVGVGTPHRVQQLISEVGQKVPTSQLAVHFHDTYGQALANIYAALQLGIHVVDGSVAGLGGCPYAQGASGNVATEDLLYMLNGLGIETGVSLTSLITAGEYISQHLQKKSHSKVAQALGEKRIDHEKHSARRYHERKIVSRLLP